ncbi:hypothetical protein XA68_18122 [Ophiocordyceps unilateralis]|uniref:Uncharacterized protein n=1 Tax=Ophiocordyceps unilateralis TaxID=268505 RepID=A0A2A9P257_OPHUN|nr:hypothetical protein XA68_18122 [Ophiocordyceps unilateralis]
MASINVLLLPFLALMGQVLGHTTSATISHTRVVIGYTIVNPVDATACMKTGTSIGLDQFFTCSRHHCQGIFVANDYSTFGEIPKDVDCVVDANKEAFDRALRTL